MNEGIPQTAVMGTNGITALPEQQEIKRLQAELAQAQARVDGEKKLREIFEADAGALRSELANTENRLAECQDSLSLAQAKCAETVERAERIIQIYDTQTISAPLGLGVPLDHLAVERLREAIANPHPGQPLLERLEKLERVRDLADAHYGLCGSSDAKLREALAACPKEGM